jgi:hypothetical protein
MTESGQGDADRVPSRELLGQDDLADGGVRSPVLGLRSSDEVDALAETADNTRARPKARNRHDWPLLSLIRASSMKTGMERRRPSTTWTKLLPDFSGRSFAIGCSLGKSRHKLKPLSVNRAP